MATEIEDDLPRGWALTTLGELVSPGKERFDPTTVGEDLPYIGLEHIEKDTGRILGHGRSTEVKSTKAVFHAGDVLYGKLRPYLNKVAIPEFDGVCSTDILVFPRGNHIESKFLYYRLLSRDFVLFANENVSGVQHPRTDFQSISRFRIALPPLAEQCRIVTRIDKIFEERMRALQYLSKIPALLQVYSASVLYDAVLGRLTLRWRAQNPSITSEGLMNQITQSNQASRLPSRSNAATPTEGVHDLSSNDIPSSWSIIELRHLCRPGKPITYGILKPGPDIDGGIPYIRVADYRENRIVTETVRRTSEEIADQYRRSQLTTSDLVLSIRGTVGRVCEVPKELDGANITQDSARLSINQLVSKDYVKYYLQSPQVQKRLRKATRGVAIRGVNLGDVRVIQVALPPLAEQFEIVKRLEVLLAYSAEITRETMASCKNAEKLANSVLQLAFNGKLVPQNPNDEPASVLLEYIGAEKVESKGKQTKIA